MSRIGMNWVVLGTVVALGCGGADKDVNTLPPPPEQAQANPTPATPMPSTPPPIEAERMGAPEALPSGPATPPPLPVKTVQTVPLVWVRSPSVTTSLDVSCSPDAPIRRRGRIGTVAATP